MTVSLLGVLGPTVNPVTAAASRYESAVARQANTERADRRLTSLVRSGCLDRFAGRQATAMASGQVLGHQDLRPVLVACRLREVGENVAFGYSSGGAATGGWLRSTAHRDNLLAPEHGLTGVGAAQDPEGHWYVSQLLAERS